MPESLEYIDSYFNGELNAEEAGQFEQRIINDREFAEEVAYYLGAWQTAKEQGHEDKLQKFREIYVQHQSPRPGIVKKLWPSVAVAVLLVGIVFGWYLFVKPVSPAKLADRYINEKLHLLPVSMGNSRDSMQTAIRLYNNGNLVQASQYLQQLSNTGDSGYRAREILGVIFLRLAQYDKALFYFRQLENDSTLYANPALFYEALALMKRNRAGDLQQAKQLLQRVVQNDLQGKENAEEWLQKW